MTWTGKIFRFNSVPIEIDWDALQADITAKANGDSGAPKNKLASMNAGSVDTVELVNNSVNQAALKTTISEVSTTTSIINLVFASGEWGFFPQEKTDGSGTWDYKIASTIQFGTRLTQIGLSRTAGSGTGFAQQRYIQASPPSPISYGGEAWICLC